MSLMSGEDQSEQRKRTDLAVTRTTLASERTFSAWIKTAIAFLAGGLGLVALMDEQLDGIHGILIVGASTILVGLSVLITATATVRYERRMRSLDHQQRHDWPFWMIYTIACGLMVVSVIGLVCLWLLSRTRV